MLIAAAPPAVGITIGIVIAVAGVFLIFVGLSRTAWSSTFRANFHYGKGPNRPPVTRIGFFLFGLSWLLSGAVIAAMVASDSPAFPIWPLLLTSFGPLMLLAVIELSRGSRPVA
jgi:hypothetical protein